MSEIKTFQYFNERIYVYESRRIRRKRYYTLNCLFQIARLWHELIFLSRNMYAAPLNRRNKIHVTKPRYSSVKCNTPILKCAHRTLSNPYLSRTLPYYYLNSLTNHAPSLDDGSRRIIVLTSMCFSTFSIILFLVLFHGAKIIQG